MSGIKIIAKNRKASFEYFLLDKFEAGIELQGSEIKSIRAGQVSIGEAFIQIDNLEAWLINSHVAKYDAASIFNHDPKRKRKLLLHKKEINQIWNAVRQKGLTVVPTILYLSNGKAKIEIALAKGKKMYDKRDSIAKRDQEREISRSRKITD
ncbi:MAG: SsrA-binding protein SmpB [Chloroflexi bacterium HGW-Chloroflexi-2]|jgi:SsrA-binding protein|nr:MAG: SsrA-binding protein SmpB [Chloroflexi bacterium HGW-Chloroflexi-2]